MEKKKERIGGLDLAQPIKKRHNSFPPINLFRLHLMYVDGHVAVKQGQGSVVFVLLFSL